MNVHEYQAKILLEKFGIPITPFEVISSEQEIEPAIKKLGLKEGVAKIQVHAGGRGKAGGVKLGKTPGEVASHAKQLLGMRIQNQQTGAKGIVAEKVLITPAINIQKEFYVAAVIDRVSARPILMVSAEGGMEIEEIAAKSPEKILKVPIQLDGRVRGYHLQQIIKFLDWPKEGRALLANVARAFLESDGELLEINPLVLTDEGKLIALDAKFSVDDNALFRQKQIADWYDPSQQTEGEVMAKKFDLAYIGLDGNIGCLVNGAGLAMGTMDIIHHFGGKPANFLDVGGSATEEQVAQGFKIILSDPNVESIFVNIFGGIMDCAVLAQGIVAASQSETIRVPLVVRMEGTNVERGKQILKESHLNIITAETMADGAQKAVKWQS